MDDEFKLCWKNFQDNIASGFQNLYDRGDLVDVTLACDGKLLHAHKIVLAICSPYFQEIFITNPCKHPIIILKDVSFNIMCELLEFMYQGVVNVKHTELQSFMKIGQVLQIKGLATNSSTSRASSERSSGGAVMAHTSEEASSSAGATAEAYVGNSIVKSGNEAHIEANENVSSAVKGLTSNASTAHGRVGSPAPSLSGFVVNAFNQQQQNYKSVAEHCLPLHQPDYHHLHQHHSSVNAAPSLKRSAADFNSASLGDALSVYARKQLRRSMPTTVLGEQCGEHPVASDMVAEVAGGCTMDSVSAEDAAFLQAVPHMAALAGGAEPRYDLCNVKREVSTVSGGSDPHGTASSRSTYYPPSAFNFDWNYLKNNAGAGVSANAGGIGGPTGLAATSSNSGGSLEYPNDLHMGNDYAKNFGNHMDIPSSNNGSSVVMLSSTSLLHGNCVFNRNNTVATQQGMKTYWLCKSYRISMCRARCITHQGRVISATGVHNHAPHMQPSGGGGGGHQIDANGATAQLGMAQQMATCDGSAGEAGLVAARMAASMFQHNQLQSTPPPPAMTHIHAAHHVQHMAQLLAPSQQPQQQRQPQQQHQQQHCIELHQQQLYVGADASLEITPLMQSSSPAQSQQRHHIQSPSPMRVASRNTTAATSAMKTPPAESATQMHDKQLPSQSHQQRQQALPSPAGSSDISATTVANEATSTADIENGDNNNNNESNDQPRIIDSITISPTSSGGHAYKLEDILSLVKCDMLAGVSGLPSVAPGEHWFHGKLEFMLSQRGKPLLVHDGHTFGIQYVRKDKKYWQCNLSRKFNCKARVTTTESGEIIVTNNEHCHTEIRQHLRKDYQRNKVMMNALINLSTRNFAETMRRAAVDAGGSGPLTPGVLDLGKTSDPAAAAPSTTSIDDELALAVTTAHVQQLKTSPHALTNLSDDDDDTVPLDCGIRSMHLPLVQPEESPKCVVESIVSGEVAKNDSNAGEEENKRQCREELVSDL